jgi:hypothetical protein
LLLHPPLLLLLLLLPLELLLGHFPPGCAVLQPLTAVCCWGHCLSCQQR